MPATISLDSEQVVLERGLLRIDVDLRPFSVTVRRAGRRLIRAGGVWAAEGEVRDQFIRFTEGVIAAEERSLVARGRRAEVLERSEDGVLLWLRLSGDRDGRLRLGLPDEDHVSLEFAADEPPLRLGVDWDRRTEERFVGLGARHGTQLDQGGRDVQLGADRRYTGPDCPPEMLAAGGIPRATAHRCRGCCRAGATRPSWTPGRTEPGSSSAGERVSISTRGSAGPLRLELFCQPTPAARLRAFCRRTGFPGLQPEWAYGFWKSRDVHEHQDDVLDDFHGFRRHEIPLDAIVIDSPWATQYNTWEFDPHQFPDARGMIAELRADGVRTVVWVTPWVNLDSRDGQIPPQPASERLHREPAPNYAPAADAGLFVREPAGEPFVSQWWMGTGSPVDFTNPAAEEWWRELARGLLSLGVEGIKADDGEGYYIPEHVMLADGRSGAAGAWALGSLYRESMQRALDEVHPGSGVVFGRSGWSGQQAIGFTWGGDQASDFWSLRVLVVASLSAAASAISNWSHDVGGYLGHRLVERCPPELFVRWVQFGAFTPLMHAHARMPQEPWNYSAHILDLYRGYVLLHERLVPYVRAAAATAQRTGLPVIRPLCLIDPDDPRGWAIGDAYGYGPSLWVAPVLDDGARSARCHCRGASGSRRGRAGWCAAVATCWRRRRWSASRCGCDGVRSSSPIRPSTWREGSGNREGDRPLVAALWGEPESGRATARLADGTMVRWHRGRWAVTPEREITFRQAA